MLAGFINAYNIGINVLEFKLMKLVASAPLNVVMTLLASSFIIVIPLMVIFLYFKKDMNVYSFVVAGILFFIVSDIIKMLTAEPRPCNVTELSWINNVACESTFSFPSNHASVLTGLTFFMGKYRYVQIAYALWVGVVLFGRVYLGLHYFTDIIAGMALSTAIFYAVYRNRLGINHALNSAVKKIVPRLSL